MKGAILFWAMAPFRRFGVFAGAFHGAFVIPLKLHGFLAPTCQRRQTTKTDAVLAALPLLANPMMGAETLGELQHLPASRSAPKAEPSLTHPATDLARSVFLSQGHCSLLFEYDLIPEG
jgi:hypothetical protein